MPKDGLPETDLATATRNAEVRLYCARCRSWVTRGCWRIAVNGGHDHVVFNPAGTVFRVLCFKEAPGVHAVGAASNHFTWFKGHAWRIALCRGCGTHLGWRYQGDAAPAIFFGLIAAALTTRDTA